MTDSDHRSEFYPTPRWVRIMFNGVWVADSKKAMLLRESGRLPLYYFPREDVRTDLLSPSDHSTHSDHKGDGVFWDVTVGDRTADHAAFTFRNAPPGGPDLSQHLAFEWRQMDHWFEEDDEVFVHARDPHKRVDAMQSSRHFEIKVDGVTVADTRRATLLFETGLPGRIYIPKDDVRVQYLEPSDSQSACPYKGVANYYSLKVGEKLHRDLVWYYNYPIAECPKIAGLLCFYSEKVDILEDGELLDRPKTPFA
ncbi:MAG: DUF427 domain-containing protein [Alphaproteobacteria bacterium]